MFLGNGDGSFQIGFTYTGSFFHVLAVGDFNVDGKPDIAAGNAAGSVTVMLGASATQLKFTTVLADYETGFRAPDVQVQDASGNIVNPFRNTLATLTLNPSTVIETAPVINGIANFALFPPYTTGVGTYSLTATSPGLTPAVSNSFKIVVSLPTVAIDLPAAGSILQTGPIVVSGWALDNAAGIGTAISSVKVMLDGTFVGTATYGISRPDVCAAYPGRSGCPNVGYRYVLNAPSPGTHTITVTATDSGLQPDTGAASVTVTVPISGSRVGVFRGGASFLVDSNGNAAYDPGVDRFISSFTGPGGFTPGDVPVAGDWTGDGRTKVGIYRASTGQWFLDSNNNGIFDAGDPTYGFGGLPGDMPFVGDWNGLGKSCIGIYRSTGSMWLLDLNGNGKFDNTPIDAFFPFGGLSGDVPVVGAWTGGNTGVGVVRKYAPGGVPQGEPFFWVLDAGAANAGNLPVNHTASTNAFAFGGLTGDVFVTGDWNNTGVSGAGIYRAGLWVLDAALPAAPQANHVPGMTFGYGGLPGDVPITGKW
jgi:hypothetical protein